MEIIQLHHPYNKTQIVNENIVMALGFFDGVHRGHQKVIQKARQKADELNVKLAVMTFNRHPSVVFQKFGDLGIKYLSTVTRKRALMEHFGVDILYEVEFTSAFAALSPQDFVDQYIVNLHTLAAVAGFDYTFGKKELAGMDQLSDYSKNRFEVIKVDPLLLDNEKISSTRIRKEVENGLIEKANQLLGHVYSTPGFVIHGEARGRELGYPTANIHVEKPIAIPKIGIYAVRIKVAGELYDGMASIGYNVTFGDRDTYSIEVNIFDFDQEIYGENVEVYWVKYLREEVKFSSVEDLVDQLLVDEKQSRKILKMDDQWLII